MTTPTPDEVLDVRAAAHSNSASENGSAANAPDVRSAEREVAHFRRRVVELDARIESAERASGHGDAGARDANADLAALRELRGVVCECIDTRVELHRAWDEIEVLRVEVARLNTWMPPGHFYSPIPAAHEIERELHWSYALGVGNPPGIDMRQAHQHTLLARIAQEYSGANFADEPGSGRRYHAQNNYYPFGDALVMRSFIRALRPRRIVEVGSGFSSAVILDTLDELGDHTAACTFVEPFPERLESLLRGDDQVRHRVLRQVVQDVPLAVFEELTAGDIVVIDSSHVAKAGSDVNFLFFDVLPRLASGVFVHIHDIIWPLSYPEPWLAEGRAWNESFLLRAFLQFNTAFEVEFSMGYAILPALDRVRAQMPRVIEGAGTAFWIRRV